MGKTEDYWQSCPVVERDPERLSGALVFRGTRMPVATLFETLRDGDTVDDFMEWFEGPSRAEVVEAVLDHAINDMQTPLRKPATPTP